MCARLETLDVQTANVQPKNFQPTLAFSRDFIVSRQDFPVRHMFYFSVCSVRNVSIVSVVFLSAAAFLFGFQLLSLSFVSLSPRVLYVSRSRATIFREKHGRVSFISSSDSNWIGCRFLC